MTAIKLMLLVRIGDDPEAWRRDLDAGLDRLAGLSRLLLNIALPVEVRAGSVQERWDVVVEGWFDTRANAEAAAAWFGARAGDVVVPLLVDERLMHDSGIRPLASKVIVLFRRRADLTRQASQAYWQGPHARLGMVEHNATDFLRLYFQNHVLADNAVDRPEHDYDGLPEYWLDADALGKVGADSAVMRAIARDEENFIDRTSLVTLLVQEETLFPHAGPAG